MRSFLFLFVSLLAVPAAQAQGVASMQAVTQTAATQAATTPAEALRMLRDGNARFVAASPLRRDALAQVRQTASGQYPFAFVLGCVDSRVPVEMVFDQGVGDLFVGRVAGNFVNTDMLGSMEFATAAAGSRLVVVLGHTACGAVKGACDHVELGNLTQTLSNISPAIYAVPGFELNRSSSNPEFVQAVAHENVKQTVQNIVDRSPVMAGLIREGKLEVIGAMHDISTGRVEFMDDTRVTSATLSAN